MAISFTVRFPHSWGLLVLLCAGCAPHPAAPKPVIPNAVFHITLQMMPPQPRQLDPIQFQVKVHDKAGKPVTQAKVIADLAMPTMDMGKNEVVLHPAGAGVYIGTGRFTMAGDWQVMVTVTRGKITGQKYFPVNAQ